MKFNKIFSAAVLAMVTLVGFNSCDTDAETETIQDLYKYDAQYFANLRAWKQTPHAISYGYYSAWYNTKTPTSYGERFLGLPDSIDIVNLWMDIPTKEDWPIAYDDMVYCQTVKGTRFVMHGDASNYGHYFWSRHWDESKQAFEFDYDADGNHIVLKTEANDEESIRAYARWAVDTVVQCGLDGVDFDYEGWGGTQITWVADECYKYFGPDGKWAEKLFIIDWFNGAPPAETEPYTDWYIRQAYTWQIGFQTGSGGRPKEKTVLCESTGAEAANGGKDGARIKDYAVWVAENGGGGCGSYYMDYNYMSTSGIPYKEWREAIQIMNPAVHK